jgi:hypothetical protein
MDLLRLEVERELADGGNKFDHQTTKGDVLLLRRRGEVVEKSEQKV